MKIIYIAGKYRDKEPYLTLGHIRDAEKMGLLVCALGAMPLIPHKNTEFFEGIQDADFFINGTLELMRRCDAVLVVSNYKTSEGAKGEIEEAERLDKPVFYSVKELKKWISKSKR